MSSAPPPLQTLVRIIGRSPFGNWSVSGRPREIPLRVKAAQLGFRLLTCYLASEERNGLELLETAKGTNTMGLSPAQRFPSRGSAKGDKETGERGTLLLSTRWSP